MPAWMGLTATGDAERLSRLAVPLLPEPQVGQERALEALQHLGYRKPYPLNAARRLGLQIPAVLAREPEAPQKPPPIPFEVQQRLEALAKRLKGKTH